VLVIRDQALSESGLNHRSASLAYVYSNHISGGRWYTAGVINTLAELLIKDKK
jgi:hypothetical protein